MARKPRPSRGRSSDEPTASEAVVAETDTGEENEGRPAAADTTETAVGGTGSGRWTTRLVVLAVLLVAAVWLAPLAIARTPLLGLLVDRATGGLPVRVTIGSARLDWFSPVRLSNVVVLDPAAEGDAARLVEIRTLTTDRQLLDLLLSPGEPGTVGVEQPVVRLAMRPGGSRLEDLLAQLPATEEESQELPDFTVEVVDGRLILLEEGTAVTGHVDKLTATVAHQRGTEGRLEMRLRGVLHDSDREGTLQAEASLPATLLTGIAPEKAVPVREVSAAVEPAEAATAASRAASAIIRLENVPVAALQPLLTRSVPGLAVECVANGELTAGWNASYSAPEGSLAGQLTLNQVQIRSQEVLGREELRLDGIDANVDVSVGGGRLQVAVLKATSAVTAFDASGEFSLARLEELANRATEADWRGLAGALSRDDWQVRSNIDLARLAALLPETLRIREGLSITSGTVRVAAKSHEVKGERIWLARADAGSLSATDGRQQFSWNRPLEAEVRVRRAADALVIDSLQCRSDFLQLTGRGDSSSATFSLSCDLDQFATELGRFVDLREIRIAGRLQGEATAAFEPQNAAFRARGNLQVEQLDLRLPRSLPWQEPQLNVLFAADGTGTPADGLEQLQQATLEVTGGRDRLSARLTEPLAWHDTEATAQLAVSLAGDLARWSRRLQAFIPLDDIAVAGMADVQGQFSLQPATAPVAIGFADVTGEIASFRLHTSGLYLDDPRVRVTTAGSWNGSTGVLVAPLTTWASTAVSARADRLEVRLTEGQLPQVTGAVAFRGGLDRLQRWTHPPELPPAVRLQGVVNGQVLAQHAADLTQGRWDITIDRLGLFSAAETVAASQPGGAFPGGIPATTVGRTQRWEPLWQEVSPVRVKGEGSYSPSAGTARLASLEVTAEALKVTASGTLSELDSRMVSDLGGTIGYDLAALSRRFPGLAESGVTIAGQQQRTFRLSGPLVALPAAGTIHTGALPTGTPTTTPGGTQQFVTGGTGAATTVGISPELTGQGSAGWSNVSAWGIDVSGGELNGTLQAGVVQFAPLNLQVAGGTLQLTPQLQLNGPEPLLHVEPGTVLSNVRLTEEMCHGWLKFVAPMLADSARAEGHFSASLSRASIPVSRPGSGDVDGVLAIHQAEVRPGPLASQLFSLTETLQGIFSGKQSLNSGSLGALTGLLGGGQSGTANATATPAASTRQLLVLPAQDVAFRLTGERIYHKSLEMQIDGIPVRTSGSVGLDDTLGLVATVPVQDSWIEGTSALASLKGQTLSIPIHGTLSRPQLDQRVLSELASKVAGAAAGRFFEKNLGGELQKQLQQGLGLPFGGSGTSTPGGTPATGGGAGTAQPPAAGSPQQELQKNLGRALDGLFGPRAD